MIFISVIVYFEHNYCIGPGLSRPSLTSGTHTVTKIIRISAYKPSLSRLELMQKYISGFCLNFLNDISGPETTNQTSASTWEPRLFADFKLLLGQCRTDLRVKMSFLLLFCSQPMLCYSNGCCFIVSALPVTVILHSQCCVVATI